MATNDDGPTLTDAVGMGGMIAQDGFSYQAWEGLVRLPGWLSNPAFEAVIFEGLEDVEASFFAPHAPNHRLLERLQAKSGDLGPKDVKDVFERFHGFESKHPHVTRVHTLVTQQLPTSLKWVGRDAARVRRARPFYAPFRSIQAASDDRLVECFTEEFGNDLGRFVADGVEVMERPMPSRAVALSAFAAALIASLPATDLGQRKVTAAFEALEALVRRSVGVPLARRELVQLLESETGETLFVDRPFPVHVRSDRNGESETALEIDASAFSGDATGFPAPSRWQAELVAPLDATCRWLRTLGVSRVALSGSYRLTTALVVGWSLRAAAGFELQIPTRDAVWATDDRPVPGEDSGWEISLPQTLHGDRLVVCVGVLRRPIDDLVAAGRKPTALLSAVLSEPLRSAKAAQHGAAQVKAAVSGAVALLGAKGIDLYFAGPASFAVALGHRWNAMPTTQLHEFIATRREYVPTASLTA